jgi:SAM-dependent methyltransferase
VTERALSFGAVAERYERFRFGYPAAVADVVLGHADGPVRTALEVGAGTGKATRLFAARGVAVTATDPDGAMLAELRRQVPGDVVTVESPFEALPTDRTYDLVFAAAALHWTRAERRWDRMAGLLRPGGVVASFGGEIRLADPALEDAVRAAREPVLPVDDVPSPDGTPPDSAMQWPGTEMLASPWFEAVRQHVVERRPTLTAHDYVGHLSTVSAYLQLPEPARVDVLGRIARVLPRTMPVVADVVVHLARRVGG